MDTLHQYRHIILFWFCLAASAWVTERSFSFAYQEALSGTMPVASHHFLAFIISVALVGIGVYFRTLHLKHRHERD